MVAPEVKRRALQALRTCLDPTLEQCGAEFGSTQANCEQIRLHLDRKCFHLAMGILGCLSVHMGKIGSPTPRESYATGSDGQPVGTWAVT